MSRHGRELVGLHLRRIHIVHPLPPTPVKQALCCQCGQIRTYKDAWRAQGGYNSADRWRRRMVGRLKCSHCQAITDHALLKDPECRHRDDDEREQLLALGDPPRGASERGRDLERLRREYREAAPRNPNLEHVWWISDANRAIAENAPTLTVLCGETIPTPQSRPESWHHLNNDADRGKPRPVRLDEYEDHETGMSWRDGDCVDCLRVYNTTRLALQRGHLYDWLNYLAHNLLDSLDAVTVDELIEAVKAIHRKSGKSR
ncbi:hypothetical protein A5791_19855 [Mycobacterium sp. 852002-51163_SCH5372311]|uniref:hypothetical protein n=1 Tax=Mycobacterium sp. 852002-51163_SCH5372311 TaxID=1834097 RepID=UPI0007FCEF54|nr:hypothetical protein [Mycobacterium sp. 852002-51163_SCH5372311]OBF86953.1 hypothetical protein A5791_19855 [Mycobacterium sp. 852002-51163_SCH5372311]